MGRCTITSLCQEHQQDRLARASKSADSKFKLLMAHSCLRIRSLLQGQLQPSCRHVSCNHFAWSACPAEDGGTCAMINVVLMQADKPAQRSSKERGYNRRSCPGCSPHCESFPLLVLRKSSVALRAVVAGMKRNLWHSLSSTTSHLAAHRPLRGGHDIKQPIEASALFVGIILECSNGQFLVALDYQAFAPKIAQKLSPGCPLWTCG